MMAGVSQGTMSVRATRSNRSDEDAASATRDVLYVRATQPVPPASDHRARAGRPREPGAAAGGPPIGRAILGDDLPDAEVAAWNGR